MDVEGESIARNKKFSSAATTAAKRAALIASRNTLGRAIEVQLRPKRRGTAIPGRSRTLGWYVLKMPSIAQPEYDRPRSTLDGAV
jgi:hypothetical protein